MVSFFCTNEAAPGGNTHYRKNLCPALSSNGESPISSIDAKKFSWCIPPSIWAKSCTQTHPFCEFATSGHEASKRQHQLGLLGRV
mmetsp:Transcript_22497/g.29734  ORF Transcript_22497/g.29734 Transcript_22497/m.29734 type:complete len:85 (+) Transcript_22497:1278-1532(+)